MSLSSLKDIKKIFINVLVKKIEHLRYKNKANVIDLSEKAQKLHKLHFSIIYRKSQMKGSPQDGICIEEYTLGMNPDYQKSLDERNSPLENFKIERSFMNLVMMSPIFTLMFKKMKDIVKPSNFSLFISEERKSLDLDFIFEAKIPFHKTFIELKYYSIPSAKIDNMIVPNENLTPEFFERFSTLNDRLIETLSDHSLNDHENSILKNLEIITFRINDQLEDDEECNYIGDCPDFVANIMLKKNSDLKVEKKVFKGANDILFKEKFAFDSGNVICNRISNSLEELICQIQHLKKISCKSFPNNDSRVDDCLEMFREIHKTLN